MCVVSMIMDAKYDQWQKYVNRFIPLPSPQITQAEIDEFRELLRRAREYDKKHNEPDCELEEKRKRIKDLAEELGIEVDFV
jgi:hypothetical protein